MIRPLITLIIEYPLALFVYKKGQTYPKIFAGILFLLATYQFGELVTFVTDGDRIGLQIAYFATTLLPPFGILVIQKITNKNYGYYFLLMLSIIFAFGFVLFNSSLIHKFEVGDYCIKVHNYGSRISDVWAAYYIGTLSLSMVLLSYHWLTAGSEKIKNLVSNLLIGYASFFIVTLAIVLAMPEKRASAGSMMCALAFFGALIFTRVSLRNYQCSDEETHELMDHVEPA